MFQRLLVVYVLLCPVGGAVSRTLHDYVQIAMLEYIYIFYPQCISKQQTYITETYILAY